MYILAHIAVLLVAVALERACPSALRWGGVAPNWALVLVACIGITRGNVAGTAAGLYGGLLVAATGESSFGATLLSYMVVGFLCGQARGRVFADHILVAPILATIVTIIAMFITLVLDPPSNFLPWLGGLGRQTAYNAAISLPAYYYARALARRWPKRADT